MPSRKVNERIANCRGGRLCRPLLTALRFIVRADRVVRPYKLTTDRKSVRAREDADLSQRQLAEILHMHKTTYARYASGKREIPLNIAILMAKYYRVSMDYLAGLK